MRLLEDSEIDEWFNEEKAKLEEGMEVSLQKGADFGKEQARFDKAFRKLLDAYKARYHDAEAYKARHAQLERPIKSLAAWYRNRLLKVRLVWKGWWEHRQKARKQREYERLFGIKKKL